MKKILNQKSIKVSFFLILTFWNSNLISQSFTLPSDNKWHLIATIGGRHGFIEYIYDHATGYHPSIAKGEVHFINSKKYIIQNHQTMGYSAWNQPQFALVSYGSTSELWIKAAVGISSGTFEIINSKHVTLNLGSVSDLDLTDNGGNLKIYDKLADNSHIYTGNLNVMDGNVGIGTTTPDEKLSVNGKIHTKEVKVDLVGWSDFVFHDDYDLPSLQEVENHIKEKGHLKDIPSAKEVEENGIQLGEMNARLLQKIEELTLYVLDLKKENQKQNDQILEQTRDIRVLKSLINHYDENKND